MKVGVLSDNFKSRFADSLKKEASNNPYMALAENSCELSINASDLTAKPNKFLTRLEIFAYLNYSDAARDCPPQRWAGKLEASTKPTGFIFLISVIFTQEKRQSSNRSQH